MIIKLDLRYGSIFVDSKIITLDKNGFLAEPIRRLCHPLNVKDQIRKRYHLLKKVSVCGNSADLVIEISKNNLLSITFLFDLIEFFDSSVLESKIVKACEKFWGVKFASEHPSTAILDYFEWGSAKFFYDAKQGDLSLEIRIDRSTISVRDCPDDKTH